MDNTTENKTAEETVETAAEETVETPAQEAEVDPAEALKKALEDKEKEYLYLRAEYDNFRRRSVKEKSDAYAKAKSDAAMEFLSVYDNLERALQQGTDDEAFLKGVEMTMTQLKQALEKLNIKPIECVGQPFDPNLHNAVMHVDDPELGENVVKTCFQTGFIMGEKVIRFAMVQVAN